ncbi:archaetidylserine decarboxylase [Aliikangiella maris]
MSIIEQLQVTAQYLIPQHTVSVLAGKLAESQTPWFKNWFIQRFAKAYQIDMSIAVEPELTQYASFNEFFTRPIRPETRPIDADINSFCSPVDGCMSQFGPIESGRLIQAKNHHFTTLEVLGGDESQAAHFAEGEFCTIYLAPKDYHRIHMPCDGKLVKMSHIPGRLFSVNPLTANNVPHLFARNERVVSYFETDFGLMAMIAVGATIVGSIETVWQGTITPPTAKSVTHWDYAEQNIHLEKGAEMGRFKLGSTVILLMQKASWQWAEKIGLQQDIRLGEKLITRKPD